MNIDYWVTNSGSFIHQIFMIVMAGLYGLAYLLSVSYKAINIYCYFVLFPLSLSAFFLKGWWKLLFIPVSLLFFLIPGFEILSVKLFDICVDFLNYSAQIFSSNYIAMSVYICVLVPILIYLPLIYFTTNRKAKKIVFGTAGALLLIYMIFIYPNFQEWLLNFRDNNSSLKIPLT